MTNGIANISFFLLLPLYGKPICTRTIGFLVAASTEWLAGWRVTSSQKENIQEKWSWLFSYASRHFPLCPWQWGIVVIIFQKSAQEKAKSSKLASDDCVKKRRERSVTTYLRRWSRTEFRDRPYCSRSNSKHRWWAVVRQSSWYSVGPCEQCPCSGWSCSASTWSRPTSDWPWLRISAASCLPFREEWSSTLACLRLLPKINI